MNRWLLAALAASAAATLGLALAPDADQSAADLLPSARPRPTKPALPPAAPANERATHDAVASAGAAPGQALKDPSTAGQRALREAPPLGRGGAWPAPSASALAAWQGPPAPAPAAARAASDGVAARPTPPPFPYQWLGRLDDGQTVQALLSGPQRSLAVAEGAVLDKRWRLDRIGGNQLSLTWLPGGDSITVAYRLKE